MAATFVQHPNFLLYTTGGADAEQITGTFLCNGITVTVSSQATVQADGEIKIQSESSTIIDLFDPFTDDVLVVPIGGPITLVNPLVQTFGAGLDCIVVFWLL